MSKHKVKTFSWVQGKLKVFEAEFNSRWHAEQHALVHSHHHDVTKIYDVNGSVVNEIVKQPLPVDATYA